MHLLLSVVVIGFAFVVVLGARSVDAQMSRTVATEIIEVIEVLHGSYPRNPVLCCYRMIRFYFAGADFKCPALG
jgi:hypothetical protein